MGRDRVYLSRTICSFSIEAQKLKELDEIATREGKERTEILQELVEKFVDRRLKNPNPQTTLEVKPYPNPWTDSEEAWGNLSEFSIEQVRDMVEIGAPRFDRLKAIIKEADAKKGKKIDPRDVEWLVKSKGITEDEARKQLKAIGRVD